MRLLPYPARILIGRGVLVVSAFFVKYMLANLVIVERRFKTVIEDTEGRRIRGFRSMRAYPRWKQEEYLRDGRVSVGPTGILTRLDLISPPSGRLELIEGSTGTDSCSFRVRAPGMRPTYLVRRPHFIEEAISYEANDVYTKPEVAESLSWILRIPTNCNIPHRVVYELQVPEEHPLVSEPSVYRHKDLAAAEAVRTDRTLDQADGWTRLPPSTLDSHLELDGNLTKVHWSITPIRTNTAYMITWDWWQDPRCLS